MRKISLGIGKGTGIIPMPVGTLFAAQLEGFEFAPTREGRENKKLLAAIDLSNSAETAEEAKEAMEGFDSNLFYERVVLVTSDNQRIRTINEGYTESPMALKVIKRNYSVVINGKEEPREGKAIAWATKADIDGANEVDSAWAEKKFADQATKVANPI